MLNAIIARKRNDQPVLPLLPMMMKRSCSTTSPARAATRTNIRKKNWQMTTLGICFIHSGSNEGRKFIYVYPPKSSS